MTSNVPLLRILKLAAKLQISILTCQNVLYLYNYLDSDKKLNMKRSPTKPQHVGCLQDFSPYALPFFTFFLKSLQFFCKK